MKFIASYTIPAIAALGLLTVTVLLGSHSIIALSLATIAFLVAVLRLDYSARRPRWEPQHHGFTRFPRQTQPVTSKLAA